MGSHEGHEEEGCGQDCQGQACEAGGFQRHQGEDYVWLEEERFDQKQEWQDCSKKQSANGKKAYAHIKGWTVAVQKSRKALGVKGFVAVKKGTALYKKAKELYQ